MDPIEHIYHLLRSPSLEESHLLPPPKSLPELRLRLQSLALPQFDEEPISQLFQDAIAMWNIQESPPYVLPEDPLEALANLQMGYAPNPPSDDVPEPEIVNPTDGANAIHTLLGAELLRLAHTQALAPAARKEALEATTIALINPTTENVRAILRALVKGLDV